MEIEDIWAEQEKIQEHLFRGKTKNLLIGEHQSRFKGAGYEIQSVDEWRQGDPIEDVNLPLSLVTWPKKIFVTRKMKTKISPAVLVVDISPSIFVEIDEIENKFRLELCLALALGLAAIFYHDPVGVLCFSDNSEEFFLSPKFGRGQLFYALEQILIRGKTRKQALERKIKVSVSNSARTNLNVALEILKARIKPQCSIVILSDFVDAIRGDTEINSATVEALSAKHNQNFITIFLDDPLEFSWRGKKGLVPVIDIETGKLEHVRSSRAAAIRNEFVQKRDELRKKLSDMGVDSAVISYGDHYNVLAQFLAERRSASK